jgi:hypothetical protein
MDVSVFGDRSQTYLYISAENGGKQWLPGTSYSLKFVRFSGKIGHT